MRETRRLRGRGSVSAARDIRVSVARISGTGFQVVGDPELPRNELPSTLVRVVAPDYFKTLGIPILQGREFADDDQREGAPNLYVVNEAFVKKYFPARDPLAASLLVQMQNPNPGRIIGVVGNVKDVSLRGVFEPTVFYNNRQLISPGMTLMVRSSRRLELAREASQIVRDMDRNLPLIEVRMLEDAFSETIARERLNAVVSGAFAISALLLASLGLYGLVAYTVTERTNEIGIRIALGARTPQVLSLVMSDGFRLVVFGAAAGLIVAFAVSRFLESILFGVTTHDPTTFGFVAALLAVVCAFAVLIPARRATRVNPLVVLRND